jgi:hypothetical protein
VKNVRKDELIAEESMDMKGEAAKNGISEENGFKIERKIS